MSTDYDPDLYWFEQRAEDAYFAMHGHLPGSVDVDCSLCGNTEPDLDTLR